MNAERENALFYFKGPAGFFGWIAFAIAAPILTVCLGALVLMAIPVAIVAALIVIMIAAADRWLF